jgi:hypothetical protein
MDYYRCDVFPEKCAKTRVMSEKRFSIIASAQQMIEKEAALKIIDPKYSPNFVTFRISRSCIQLPEYVGEYSTSQRAVGDAS